VLLCFALANFLLWYGEAILWVTVEIINGISMCSVVMLVIQHVASLDHHAIR
jgi:hypothetical protein